MGKMGNESKRCKFPFQSQVGPHQIAQYPELEGTHEAHQYQFLTPHRAS